MKQKVDDNKYLTIVYFKYLVHLSLPLGVTTDVLTIYILRKQIHLCYFESVDKAIFTKKWTSKYVSCILYIYIWLQIKFSGNVNVCPFYSNQGKNCSCLIYFSILSQCLSFVITELGLLGLAEQNTGTEDGEVRSKGMKGCSGVVISI